MRRLEGLRNKMRLLKTLHGWLGVFVLPWVLIIGLTGLYLNHESLVTGFLDGGSYDEAQFDVWPDPQPMTPDPPCCLQKQQNQTPRCSGCGRIRARCPFPVRSRP